MYNFIKQSYIEIERGLEYMNYQMEVAIFIDFWQKRRLKDPKIKNYRPILKLKRIFMLCKTLWYHVARFRFQYSVEKIYFYRKLNYKQNNWAT